MKQRDFILALGSNLSTGQNRPIDHISAAFCALEHESITVTRRSAYYRSPAFPNPDDPEYVNAAALVRAPCTPDELLARLHRIEADIGRRRDVRWDARVIDIDLIAAGSDVLPNRATQEAWVAAPLSKQMSEAPQELILPHPRLQDRAFVLLPLRDIAPDWHHPVSGQSVTDMILALPAADLRAVTPFKV